MADYQAELEALKAQERSASKTPKWAREVGDAIVAKVLERGELAGKYGTSERLIVEVAAESTEGGKPLPVGEKRSIACSTAMLIDWVEVDDPQPGDTVMLYFHDRVQGQGGGQPWHDIRAKVIERAPAADDDIPF